MISDHLCECGCGQYTNIATKNNLTHGHYHGQPFRFCCGHYHRKGDKNAKWKGDDAAKEPKHRWLVRNYPKTGVCERCDRSRKTTYSFDHRLGDYTRNRGDYQELCSSCHRYRDFDLGVFERSNVPKKLKYEEVPAGRMATVLEGLLEEVLDVGRRIEALEAELELVKVDVGNLEHPFN